MSATASTRLHYAPVGAALLWTLEQGSARASRPTVKDAWTTAYGALSGAMIAAAEQRGRRLNSAVDSTHE